MNRGGRVGKKSPHQKEEVLKEKPNPRNPLKDLNSSSSTSVEAPRGCFRFLLSNSSSKTATNPRSKPLPKTPKSAPNARNIHHRQNQKKTTPSSTSNPRSKLPMKKNPPKTNLECLIEPRSQNPQKPRSSCLSQWQKNGKRSVLGGRFLEEDSQLSLLETDAVRFPHLMKFVENEVNHAKKWASEVCSGETQTKVLEGQSSIQPSDVSFGAVSETNRTPVSKFSSGSCSVSTPDNASEEHFTTPPLQVSISPKLHSVYLTEQGCRPQLDVNTPFIKASEQHSTTAPGLNFGSVLETIGTPMSKISSGSCLVSTLVDKALEEHLTRPPCMASVSPIFDSVKPSKLRFTPQLDIDSTPSNRLSSGFCLVAAHDMALERRSRTPPYLGFRSSLEMNTTPVNKSTSGSCLVSTPETTSTPPIQDSISPEIICESSLLSTPACFGAGHVVVGLSDKRKCRPRGILTVGEEFHDTTSCNSRASLIPVPTEASMQWLSPTNNAKNGIVEHSPEIEGLAGVTPSPESALGFSDGSTVRLPLVPSPTGASMDWQLSPCTDAKMGAVEMSSPAFEGLMGQTTSVSDATTSYGHGFGSFSGVTAAAATGPCLGILEVATADSFQSKVPIQQKEKGYRYDHVVENSPLSAESWGSRNVIFTPESDPNSDRHAGFSLMNMENFSEHQLDLTRMVGNLQALNMSPESRVVNCDSGDLLPMPRVNFPFPYPGTRTPSNSVDTTPALKQFHDQTYKTEEFSRWEALSGSNFENMSQVRISWRDGLVSRIFEMDELDCCQWLSEEEDNCCRDGRVKSESGLEFDQNMSCSASKDQNDKELAAGFGSPEFICGEQDIEKGKRKISSVGLTSCAESISTEGGGLVASDDSDWTVFYKNQLFEV